MRALILLLFAAAMGGPGSLWAQPQAPAAAARAVLDDGTRQGFDLWVDSGGALGRLTLLQVPKSSASAAVSAILVAIPEEGDGASLQIRLKAGEGGPDGSWDVTGQLAGAVKGGRFPAVFRSPTQLMVQFLQGKRGEAVGPPLISAWKNP